MRVSPFISLAALLMLAPAGGMAQEEEEAAIARATEAWVVGEISKAGELYEQALAEGGLSPSDTLTAYVRIGVWRAAVGKKEGALSAFRNASIIDPEFEYPGEAGPTAKPIYEQARTEAAGQGKLEVVVKLPTEVKSGQGFTVGAGMAETLLPLFETMTVHVEDRPGHVVHEAEQPIEANMRFDVPGGVAPTAASLTVRVAAVDPQKNEWARTTRTLKVVAAAAPVVDEAPPKPKPVKRSKGFWSSPWPYVIGGAAAVVASGVAVGVVFGTRSNVVSVNAPAWQTATFSQ